MKKNTAILLAFIGGAATGGLICFVGLKDKYDADLAEEQEAMREAYRKEIEKNDEAYRMASEEISNTISPDAYDEEDVRDYVRYTDIYKEKKEEDNPLEDDNYHDDSYDSTEDVENMNLSEEETDEFIQWDKHYSSGDKYAVPYIISLEDFEMANLHYDKETVSYYNLDDILTDEEGVIPDVTSVIGEDALLAFGTVGSDNRVVHVRNDNLATDYEVVLMDASYTESILGILPEDKKGGY